MSNKHKIIFYLNDAQYTVSYQTGMKYDGSKADYYGFERHMNAVLQPYGTYVEMKSDKAD